MAILDQVIQMQKEGRQNSEILRALQEQGLSAKEINDAINQAQIKGALNEQTMEQQQIQNQGQQQIEQPQEAQPSPEATQVQQQEPVADEQYYADTPQGYDQNYDAGSYGAGTVDPDTVTEIAQQVVEEEFKNYKKKTGDMASFKSSTEEKLQDFNERLKRIESMIDKIQQSVIQKVGEFGENTAYIRKDLENLHNTTSKLMNPLIDNINAMEKNKSHSTHKKKSSKKK